MKKSFLIALVFGLVANLVFAESNSDKFWKLMKDKNYDDATVLLSEWEQKNEKDPELYVCYFNMYYSQASQEHMHVESFLPENFNDTYFEGKNENGDKIYIFSTVDYDEEICQKAFDAIDKGLLYNPKRLDMYFGKAHLYFQKGDYENQFELLKQVMELNKKYKKSWLWSNNTPLKKTEAGFEESLHEYILKWYNTKNPDTYVYMRDLSVLWIEQYPNNPIAYNDAGLSSVFLNDYEAAKKYYEKGYELDKTDMLILCNLARICYNTGDIETARKYYEIVAASDNPEDSEYAKQILENYFD